jgi:hypothetical protein
MAYQLRAARHRPPGHRGQPHTIRLQAVRQLWTAVERSTATLRRGSAPGSGVTRPARPGRPTGVYPPPAPTIPSGHQSQQKDADPKAQSCSPPPGYFDSLTTPSPTCTGHLVRSIVWHCRYGFLASSSKGPKVYVQTPGWYALICGAPWMRSVSAMGSRFHGSRLGCLDPLGCPDSGSGVKVTSTDCSGRRSSCLARSIRARWSGWVRGAGAGCVATGGGCGRR